MGKDYQTVKKTFYDGKIHAEIIWKRVNLFGLHVTGVSLIDRELFDRIAKEMNWRMTDFKKEE